MKELHIHQNPTQQISFQAPISSTWVEINREAFFHNLVSYKKIVHPSLFAPVIKSNAYGHGIEQIARLCDEHAAVDRMCVVSLREGLLLRSFGIQKPILVLSIIDAPLEQAAAQDIIVTVYDMAHAHALNEIGRKMQKKITVHIKIDTGLSRLGFLAKDALEMVGAISKLPFIFIEGIFTHFANSENEEHGFMRQQTAQFEQVIHQLSIAGIHIPLRHMSCSAALTADTKTHGTLARAGIGLYGLWPSEENKELTLKQHPTFSLQPVLTWKTTIIQIKEIPIGAGVGYDLTFKAERTTKVATLPVGYWDGYNRSLSNNSCVIIHHQRAPIIGRIAMNLMMIDVTNIQAHVGDEVLLLGKNSEISANALAERCSTINYEIVTHINPLLPRIIV